MHENEYENCNAFRLTSQENLLLDKEFPHFWRQEEHMPAPVVTETNSEYLG
jgi:hypothetical protein